MDLGCFQKMFPKIKRYLQYLSHHLFPENALLSSLPYVFFSFNQRIKGFFMY